MSCILLVDDETNILAALKRELMACIRGLEVEAYSSPAEALERAKTKSFDLVVADYQMPEMDGVTFFKAFQEIQPDAARIMLSGQVDLAGLVELINLTHIYRFIAKPWNEHELLTAITQALAYRKVVMENRRLATEYEAIHGGWTKFYLEKDYQILVVDDEQSVLSAMTEDLLCNVQFHALYAAMHQEVAAAVPDTHHFHFDVQTTISPLEALEWAQQTTYDLVIADHHMPEMDGVRFLEEFLKIQPDAACLLLSGHADMQALVSAINNTGIYGFITKPWNGHQLRSTVTQAIAHHNLLLDSQQLAKELKYGVNGLTV